MKPIIVVLGLIIIGVLMLLAVIPWLLAKLLIAMAESVNAAVEGE